MISIAVGLGFLGYVFLYAGIKGGDTARHPWRGVSGG